jgi:hypothetical protein
MRRISLRRRKNSPRAASLRVEGLEARQLLSTASPSAISDMYAVPQAIGRPLTPADVALIPSGYTADVPSMSRPLGEAGPATTAPYTPAQIRHAYGIDQLSENGAGQTIAIIDAYDLSASTITSDLTTFDNQSGLPAPPSFTVNTPTAPVANSGWDLEIALDVEWAHAIAPAANILLVETASTSFTSLLGGVSYAVSQGANQVSMSWGGSEFSGEASYSTTYFDHPGVTFLASTGDTASELAFPATSPYVTSVGGTTLAIDSSGNYISESAWSGGGGGISTQFSEPSYQSGFMTSSQDPTGDRGVPDVAYDADPNTGVVVYDGGWYTVGGTSVGSPQWAGLVALANQGRVAAGESTLGTGQTFGTNSVLYQLAGGTSYTNSNGDYNDVTTGSNGHPTTVGYDLATGLGSPVANKLIPNLITPPSTSAVPTIGDAEFQAVQVGAGNYVYDPSGSAWTFSGAPGNGSGLTGNNSPFTSGNPNAPVGTQVAFLQGTGTITQSVAGWAAGTYTVSFDAAQRGNHGVSLENFEVLVDGNVVGTFGPTGTTYQTYTTNAFTVTAGAHTIEFLGLDSAGGDNTAFLDAVTVAVASTVTTNGPAIGDNDFSEIPIGNSYVYDPSGSAWTFSGVAGNGSGVTGNDSAFTSGNPNAPQGTQVAFLQENGTITQSVTGWSAASYTLSFDAAMRGNHGGVQNFEVLIDGNVVGTFQPTTTSYQVYTTNTFTVTAGTHTIEFLGINSAGGDDTDFLDDVTATVTSTM